MNGVCTEDNLETGTLEQRNLEIIFRDKRFNTNDPGSIMALVWFKRGVYKETSIFIKNYRS